jgi:hypothetical protein
MSAVDQSLPKRFVWAQNGTEGMASYHLGTDGENYIKYEDTPWVLADDTPPPRQKYFINSHFDLDGRKFTGEIDWTGNDFYGSQRWVYEMNFSAD